MFKQRVLAKPWILPSSISARNRGHKKSPPADTVSLVEQPEEKSGTKQIDFKRLPPYAHSIRNFKLLLLSHIKGLQRFSPVDLLTVDEIHYAATCVARHDLPKGFTERDVTNVLLAALNLLLQDGNIIVPKSTAPKDGKTCVAVEETFIVVGTWNLTSTIKSVANRTGVVVVRDIWKKIVSWGNGWDGTTRGVIGVVVEDVLNALEGQEWVESRPGVWTKVDI